MNSFVGIPIKSRGKMVGMAGLANRPGGYTDEMIAALSPVTATYASLLVSKKYEEELVTSRERFQTIADELRKLVSTSGAPILELNSEFRVEVWSQNLSRLTGCPESSAVGQNFVQIFVPEDERTKLLSRLKSVMETTEEETFEFPILSTNGTQTLLLASCSARLDVHGKPSGLFIVGQDISAMKRNQVWLEAQVRGRTEELQLAMSNWESSAKRRTNIIQALGDGLVVLNEAGNVELINPKAKELLSQDCSVEGLPYSEIFSHPKLLVDIQDLLDQKEVTRVRTIDRVSETSARHLSVHGSTVSKPDGSLDAITMVMHDLTAERNRSRAKSQFLSTAAHELRTPLTSVLGFAELLHQRQDLSPPQQQKYLSTILRQTKKLGALVDDLLNLSRIEAEGGFALNLAFWNLRDFFEESVSTASLDGTHNIQLVEMVDGEVFGDRSQLSQVMSNLLENAKRYSAPGSTIEIAFRTELSRLITKVTDQGIGISAENLKQVFDPFFRADDSNTAGDGTGLGMGICKGIVEQHGGRIWVESELGRGTTVHWWIPLAAKPADLP